jgi:GAF domain-containing protein
MSDLQFDHEPQCGYSKPSSRASIMKAPIPPNEAQRLAALKAYHILDTDAEQVFDDLATVAAFVCDVPMATISLVDESRQWFKARVGVTQQETSRDIAFCAHTILESEPLVVRDALRDTRFAESPLVRAEPHIRFYAGFPLTTQHGLSLGALCAMDRKPRRLNPSQDQAMRALARQVMAVLDLRRVSAHLATALEKVKTLHGLLPICSWCKRIRDDEGYWKQVEAYLSAHTDADFTHGICPDCLAKVKPQIRVRGPK